jgi:energy-coupling factor transport system permease protein
MGGYLPIDSVLHRLDPRAKLICFCLMLPAVFCSKSWTALGLSAAAVGGLLILSGISVRTWVVFLTRFGVMFLLVFLANALFTQHGEIVYFRGIATPFTYEGVAGGAVLACHLCLMILLSLLLTATTNPRDLARAFEWFLSPLKAIGIRTREVGIILLLALRFLPVISAEAQNTADAQRARGVDVNAGGIAARARNSLALLVPAFRNALRRADLLTEAMSARGFVPGRPRTEYLQLRFGYNDLVAVICCALPATAMFLSG